MTGIGIGNGPGPARPRPRAPGPRIPGLGGVTRPAGGRDDYQQMPVPACTAGRECLWG